MRSIEQIQQLFPSSFDHGFSTADVALSRQRFGVNRLTPLARESLWIKFLAKFDEPIIKVLLAAALLSMIVALFRPPVEAQRYVPAALVVGLTFALVAGAFLRQRGHWVPGLLVVSALVLFLIGMATGQPSYDGLAVMVAVVLATGVAFVSEYQSDHEFALLNARKGDLRVKVEREGQFQTLGFEEVVVGDAVILALGDEIPADGRLVKAADLFVDQSLMTGESREVRKDPRPLDETADGPEQSGCLYRGTQVVHGIGRMIVTEVGDATYLGQIARRLSAAERVEEPQTAQDRVRRKLTIAREMTPLQEKLERLAGLISRVGYLAAAAIFLALLARGILIANPEIYWPTSFPALLAVAHNLIDYFMYMVIIIVVAVPEGLPMSVTVSLALAMRKMARANSLVRQLMACETIGSVTVICCDKTGTLTQNKMQIVRLAWAGQVFDRARGADWPHASAEAAWPRAGQPLDGIVLNAAVNSTAHLEAREGRLRVVGNSTEGALLLWLHEQGIAYSKLRLQFPALYQIHFSSERKRMTTVVHCSLGLLALVKGAPEWVLAKCSHYQTAEGEQAPLTPALSDLIQKQLREAAGQALRTLAFAFARLGPETPAEPEVLHAQRAVLENDLIFAGFVAIGDPLRVDVKEALAQCRQAGIDVKMITGDNLETARAVAGEIGLLNGQGPLVLTSQEFNALSDEELKDRLPRLRVLARARPLDKLRMVQLLQELGEVVAVTGDGTNDAPALRQADVGLSMGRAGTEVAKEASKIVLLDDAFATIVKAVHWGRSLFENIQRFLQFQLTINVSALVIALLGPCFGVKPPFTILQLLWVNVLMDTLASIALCSEPPRPGLMLVPPKRRDDSIISRPMLWTIITTAAFVVVAMMALLLGMENGWWLADTEAERSRSFPELTYWQVAVFFTVFVFFQVWNEINSRSLTPQASGFQGLHRNRVFLAILGLIVVGQVLLVTFGGDIFEVRPLGLLAWLAIAVGTASVLVYAEIVRRIRLAAGLA